MSYNKITFGGNQIVDLLYIGGDLDITDKDIASLSPVWDENTIMIANFDNNLNGGNVELGETISGNKVYRKKIGSSKMEYVKTLENNEEHFVDYMVKNNGEYVYYLFPIVRETVNGTTNEIILPPVESNLVSIQNDEWSLMIVDETENKNIFTLAKLFKFGLNLSTGDMNTNNQVNVLNNFTPYPKIQKGNSNYWSGSLSALIGFTQCSGEYIQTPNMIEELKALAIDGRRKFLKDLEGHIFEIEISNSISIATDDNFIQQPKTVSIKWVEVGNAEGISIINPRQTTTWLLTNTGTPLSYHTYVWDDSADWDDAKYWTEPIDMNNLSTYMEREISGGDDIWNV